MENKPRVNDENLLTPWIVAKIVENGKDVSDKKVECLSRTGISWRESRVPGHRGVVGIFCWCRMYQTPSLESRKEAHIKRRWSRKNISHGSQGFPFYWVTIVAGPLGWDLAATKPKDQQGSQPILCTKAGKSSLKEVYGVCKL